MCVQCGTCVKNCPQVHCPLMATGKWHLIRQNVCSVILVSMSVPMTVLPRTCEMTPEEVYAKVKKQIPFIRGISVSGGECMLHPDFLTELFRLAKKDGLGTLIDSNGTISFEDYPELMEVSDGVMLDIKAFEPEEHKEVTDVTNEMVLKNAVYLAKTSKLYEVRAVIVPDLYDTENSVRKIGDFLAPYLKIHDIRVKIIAYRPMGVREEYAHYQIPDQDYLIHLADIMKEKGFEHVTVI